MKPRVKHLGGLTPWAVMYGEHVIVRCRIWRITFSRALVLAKDLARSGATGREGA